MALHEQQSKLKSKRKAAMRKRDGTRKMKQRRCCIKLSRFHWRINIQRQHIFKYYFTRKKDEEERRMKKKSACLQRNNTIQNA